MQSRVIDACLLYLLLPCSAPSEVPSNVVPTVTSRTISVSWDAIDCSNQNGPNFRYDVDFRPIEDRIAAHDGTINHVTFMIGGLQPFANYTFRVRGVNDAGNGNYTTLMRLQTDQDSMNSTFRLYIFSGHVI